MLDNKYDQLFRDFGLQHPQFYEQTVDWCPSGQFSIFVKLENGKCYDYDRMDGSLRRVRSKDDAFDDDILTKELGANLRKNIPLTGKTQMELCEELGITRAMMSRYICGKATPSATKLYRIAKAIGCTMEELFDENYMD